VLGWGARGTKWCWSSRFWWKRTSSSQCMGGVRGVALVVGGVTGPVEGGGGALGSWRGTGRGRPCTAGRLKCTRASPWRTAVVRQRRAEAGRCWWSLGVTLLLTLGTGRGGCTPWPVRWITGFGRPGCWEGVPLELGGCWSPLLREMGCGCWRSWWLLAVVAELLS
jgi:hypothetical protein